MMGKQMKSTVVAILLCSLLASTFATAVQDHRRSQRSLKPAYYDNDEFALPEAGQGQYASGDLLDAILSRPVKRQWCRRGMTYNHVLGTCTLSFAAMRGRGRHY